MKAIILKKKILAEVYSASGMEILNERIFIIGDDSPYLYIFDLEGQLVGRKVLFEYPSQSTGRIPKKDKPDLETLTKLDYVGRSYLLTLGSGSKAAKRDKGFLIDINTFEIRELSLENLYGQLRKEEVVVGNGKLNLEGLCANEKEIILFARGNISGRNITLNYKLNNFFDHLFYDKELDKPTISQFNLPYIEGWASGFSGAVYNEKTKDILITATVEKTLNEIDDGDTIGSFLGIIPFPYGNEIDVYPILEDGKIFAGKVESVAILDSGDPLTVLAVTDSDGGASELLWIQLSL